ncbi:MAG TPA: tetratricopeptide repeat protein, partial [Actinomycetota bacterium]|nr:tetratricopeptide repeat protein [Actinomycetota bacterium]
RRLLMTSPLVTVLGPGGVGKSRLGLHVARRALPAFRGVWLAELAAASQSDLVPGRVAAAVGASGSHAVDALAELFGEDEHLLVLDTCEHVAAACAELSAELLRRCPSLRIMATSRVPLRLPQEAVWTMPPMDEREVVELFRARSRVADADDAAIASICMRLDGMPLAVELAAAQAAEGRMDVLSERIDAALRLPTAAADPRHATLQATIDWSHELLTSDEQAALRRLAVFAGGWTRQAAASACGIGDELDALVEASLVVARGSRYRMLDTIREYASQRLADAGETSGVLHAYATWLADLLVSYDEYFNSDRTMEAAEVLGAEHENISAALAHTLETDIGLAATIACNAYMYWEMRGYWDEGRRWLDRIAARADELEPLRRASLLRWAASMARRQGDLEVAEPWVRQAYEAYESLGLKPGAASCLNQLALMAQTRQDLDEAQALFDRALQLTVELEDRLGQAILRMNASFNHVYRGDRAAAEAELLEVLAIRRELRDDNGVADVLLNLAKVAWHFGDHGAGVPYLEEAAELYAGFGDDQGYAACLYHLASAALEAGDRDAAVEQATESLELARRVGDRELIGWAETLLAPLVSADA